MRGKNSFKLYLQFVAFALLLNGCATFNMMKPPPEVKQTFSVHVSKGQASRMTMPIGAYHIPDSSTYISGHQRGEQAAVMFGGLLGAAIAASTNKSRAKEMIASVEESLKLDMITPTNSILTAKIKEHSLENMLNISGDASAKGTQSLSLQPYIVLTYVSDMVSRPFVVIEATLVDASGSKIWGSRYLSTVNDDRTLAGENGWGSDSGKPFRDVVARALENAVDIVLRDMVGKLPRAMAKEVKLKARFAFMNQDIEVTGKLIESNDKTVVFVPRLGDLNIFAGVNIFEKDLVQISNAPAPSK
jgi:hypothetical protein